MTQTEYKFVFAPWDLCIETLAALKLTGGWPLKGKYWTPIHPSCLFLTILCPPSPPAFILCFSFGLISCRVSFRVAVTIDTRRGKKPVERKKRERKTLCSTWWLIFDGQFPHEFPIAFHSGLVMCRRLRMEIVWLDAQLIISIKWPFHFSINKQGIQKLNENVSPSVGKSANFFVPKIEHAIVFLSSFDTVF